MQPPTTHPPPTPTTQPEISLSLSRGDGRPVEVEEAETVISITTADTAQSTTSERDRSNVLRMVGRETSRSYRDSYLLTPL